MQVDTIIHPQWIIPITPEQQTLEDHAIVVKDGKIAAIEPIAQVKQNYQTDTLIELPQQVVLPGFVNSHAHAAMSL